MDPPATVSSEAVAEDEATHLGQRFLGLCRAWDDRLATHRYRSRKGLLPPGAGVFMPLLHGMGATTSHAGTMLATLNTLTASKKKGGRSESLKRLRSLDGYRLTGGEAIDLPGSHCRPVPDTLRSLEQTVDWTAAWLAPLKDELRVPFVPIARSASAAIVLRMLQTHPGLLDAVVLLSPMAPRDAEHSNGDLLDRVATSVSELNPHAYEYMNRLQEESRWDDSPDPFSGVPTLILTGGLDTQVSDRVRERCRGWAARHAHVEFENVEIAGHDVFNLRDRAAGSLAFGRLYRFLDGLAVLRGPNGVAAG